MNIKDFVADAITQVVEGVAAARESVAEHGASAGSDPVYGNVRENKIMSDAKGRTVTLVEFDVALTAGDSRETKGGIGVFLGAVGVGSQGVSHNESSSLSRIRFSVPIVLPGEGRPADEY